MTFADAAVDLALIARLDMAIPSLKAAPALYAGNRGFVTGMHAFQTHAQQARRSQKSEPDRPGSPCAFAAAGPIKPVVLRRHQNRIDHVDHAVRLIDVRDRDGRGATLGMDDNHRVSRPLDGQLFALDGLE